MDNVHAICIDIGTTWAKLALFLETKEGSFLISETRFRSGVGSFDGGKTSVERFVDLCSLICAETRALTKHHKIARIGLTGIREGFVLVDPSGMPSWVSGNFILGDERFMGPSSTRPSFHGVADCLDAIVALAPLSTKFLSLQGYLAYFLTGTMAITRSELLGLGFRKNENARGLRVEYVPAIGHPIAYYGSNIAVYLAGTDEQAALYGAGLGRGMGLVMSTGSYWSLSTKFASGFSRLPGVRIIPPLAPYCGSASLIGYRWGIYLLELLEEIVPESPFNVPSWASGSFLRRLMKQEIQGIDAAIDAISADVIEWIHILSSRIPTLASTEIVVYGGGVLHILPTISRVMERVGMRWRTINTDATLLGCLQVGKSTIR